MSRSDKICKNAISLKQSCRRAMFNDVTIIENKNLITVSMSTNKHDEGRSSMSMSILMKKQTNSRRCEVCVLLSQQYNQRIGVESWIELVDQFVYQLKQ